MFRQAWISNDKPALVLAPMEGVTDAPMRALLTEVPGFTHCVTEFLRVSQEIPPDHVFTRHARELMTGSRTPSGAPVYFQLLGGDAEKLAVSAAAAARLGAAGIDLNFGCPAPTVNRHDGGATLLKFPSRIKEIVAAVRAAVPKEIPVSAKLRLGWDSIDAVYKNFEMAVEGGASWITIHGRTKTQGYTPPAYWHPIGELRESSHVPVIANGEIWSLEDFRRCRGETGCSHYMLGRGALANPYLASQIAVELGILPGSEGFGSDFPDFGAWQALSSRFVGLGAEFTENPNYTLRRMKQWFKLVSLRRPFKPFDDIKQLTNLADYLRLMEFS